MAAEKKRGIARPVTIPPRGGRALAPPVEPRFHRKRAKWADKEGLTVILMDPFGHRLYLKANSIAVKAYHPPLPPLNGRLLPALIQKPDFSMRCAVVRMIEPLSEKRVTRWVESLADEEAQVVMNKMFSGGN